MKNFKIVALLVFTLSLTSCSITERLIINEDGTGKFAYEIDGSKMMSMMGGAMKSDDSSDKKEKKAIDSTFTFKEIFAEKKDSIAKLPLEEQEKIKKMEKFSMRMLVDEENGKMNYTMFTDFASIKELQNIMSPFETMKSMSPDGKKADGLGMNSDALGGDSSASFFYDGKTFSKKVAKKIVEKNIEEDEENGEANELADKMKESMEMVFLESNFKVVYQFPKPVKKVSNKTALYSEDRKTITIEYPLKDYMENPSSLTLDVEFQ